MKKTGNLVISGGMYESPDLAREKISQYEVKDTYLPTGHCKMFGEKMILLNGTGRVICSTSSFCVGEQKMVNLSHQF